jgi:hypothetical protein
MNATGRARVIARTLFETDGGAPASERLDWLEMDLADFIAKSDTFARWVICASLWIVIAIAPLAIGKLESFARLETRDQRRALARIEQSRLGPAFFVCKAILCILYLECPLRGVHVVHA